MPRTVVLVVLDSVGIGGAPDATEFGDDGSATLPHVLLSNPDYPAGTVIGSRWPVSSLGPYGVS